MIEGIAVLLVCQLAGEALVRWLGMPLPGPVVGMMLLVVGLAVWEGGLRRRGAVEPTAPLGRVSDGLLGSLGILFVPAGVGVVQYLGLIGGNLTAIGVTLVVSTVVTLLATVATFRLVRRAMGEEPRGEGRS